MKTATKPGSSSFLSPSQVADLQHVEDIIRQKLSCDAPLLSNTGEYLLSLGGKRIRPALTLVCADSFGLTGPKQESDAGRMLLDVAAGIELIHMATLLHDDIIDKSSKRRHQDSALVRFGLPATLLAGDFLLVRAFGLCARLDRFIIDATERACIALTEGEILETSLFDQSHTLESSLRIARDKTAALFSLACVCAGHLARAGSQAETALFCFGEELGIAFQILDDILDATASEDLLGKPSGQDIRERKPSVVNVLWLARGSSLSKRLMTPPGADEDDFVASALMEIRSSDVIAAARELAHERVHRARLALDEASSKSLSAVNSSVLRQLEGLAMYVLSRLN